MSDDEEKKGWGYFVFVLLPWILAMVIGGAMGGIGGSAGFAVLGFFYFLFASYVYEAIKNR